MSQAESQRLSAHCRLITVIEALKIARSQEAERVALLTLLVAELSSVEVPT